MPTSQQILNGLTTIATHWRGLAIAWHVVWGAALLAVTVGWRPERRLAGTLLAMPAASVSVLAWLTGNHVNGIIFAVLAVALGVIALRLPRNPVALGAPWLIVAGGVLIAFGWVYPHFLGGSSVVAYLYAAPLGLRPCPTLSAMVGVAMVLNGLGSRAWSLVLSGSGALYGAIGWLHLGVVIDGVLLVGAIALAIAAVSGIARADGGHARTQWDRQPGSG